MPIRTSSLILANKNQPQRRLVELYDMIKPLKLYRPVQKTYVVDRLMAANGHSVLRLPPYHPELNPIEKIWAQVKNYVGTHNVNFKFDDVCRLAEEQFQKIGREQWEAVCRHVQKIEEEYLMKEVIVDDVQEMIFSVNTGDSDGDFAFSTDEENSDNDVDLGCSSLI